MTSPIRVYAPVELKAAFKHQCTLLGVSMSERAIALIEADIAMSHRSDRLFLGKPTYVVAQDSGVTESRLEEILCGDLATPEEKVRIGRALDKSVVELEEAIYGIRPTP